MPAGQAGIRSWNKTPKRRASGLALRLFRVLGNWVAEGVVMLPVRHYVPGGCNSSLQRGRLCDNRAVSHSGELAAMEVHSCRPVHTESSQSLFVDIQTDTGIQRRLNLAALDSEHLLACEDPKRGRPLLFRQQRESDKS